MSNLKQLESDASKALNCLYIEVSKEIADDVNVKVLTYIDALRTDITAVKQAFEQVRVILTVPASNRRMMQIAGPARQCLNVIKSVQAPND